MQQAIITKFLGPTNHRGPRIQAKSYGATITVSYDHALSVEQNHEQAAWTLRRKLKQGSPQDLMTSGGSPDGRGYVFVFASN